MIAFQRAITDKVPPPPANNRCTLNYLGVIFLLVCSGNDIAFAVYHFGLRIWKREGGKNQKEAREISGSVSFYSAMNSSCQKKK